MYICVYCNYIYIFKCIYLFAHAITNICEQYRCLCTLHNNIYIYRHIHTCIDLSIDLSIYLSVCLSLCQNFYLYVYLYMHNKT